MNKKPATPIPLFLSSVTWVVLMLVTCLVDGRSAIAQRDMTEADIERLVTELSNWGRWVRKTSLARSI